MTALDQCECTRRDTDRSRGGPPARQLEFGLREFTRFVSAVEPVQAQRRLRAPGRICRILDPERSSDAPDFEEVRERLFNPAGLKAYTATCLEKVHPEAGRSHGNRALDQVVGLVGFALFEKNLGEICRPLGFKPWPLEHLAHPQVLFCAEEVASFPADDAPDQVSHRQIHDVAPLLRRRDRRRQRAGRLVHLARERQRVQRVHREQQLVRLGERAERLRAACVLDRALS